MAKVLLTGFEPFGKYNDNSSWAVAGKVLVLLQYWLWIL